VENQTKDAHNLKLTSTQKMYNESEKADKKTDKFAHRIMDKIRQFSKKKHTINVLVDRYTTDTTNWQHSDRQDINTQTDNKKNREKTHKITTGRTINITGSRADKFIINETR
jgi:hypothetical protein